MRPLASLCRHGLTSTEVLVGVLVTGLVILVLIPGIVRMRAMSGEQAGTNRQRAMGVAIHAYIDTYQRLPTVQAPAKSRSKAGGR